MATTKEQERAALKKIADIIQGLGPESYLSAAFDGCIELAEENITNDFMTSFKDRAERAYKAELIAKAVQQDQATVIKRLENELKEYETINDNQRALIGEKEGILKESINHNAELLKKNAEQFDKIQALENQLITLKAKLYDLMTA